jgi:hypothetical protein
MEWLHGGLNGAYSIESYFCSGSNSCRRLTTISRRLLTCKILLCLDRSMPVKGISILSLDGLRTGMLCTALTTKGSPNCSVSNSTFLGADVYVKSRRMRTSN